mgnify:CR=1 FL=1
MTERANPFADLGDFDAATPPKPKPTAAIEKIAQDNGFPSRTARRAEAIRPEKGRAPRRYTTGRNRQLNLKATQETVDRFNRLADDLAQPLAVVLELALDALEKQKR